MSKAFYVREHMGKKKAREAEQRRTSKFRFVEAPRWTAAQQITKDIIVCWGHRDFCNFAFKDR